VGAFEVGSVMESRSARGAPVSKPFTGSILKLRRPCGALSYFVLGGRNGPPRGGSRRRDDRPMTDAGTV